MLLAIDIGNSNVVMGVYYDGLLSHTWRLDTPDEDMVNAYKERLVQLLFEAKIDFGQITTVVLSSVIPSLVEPVEKFLQDFFHAEIYTLGPSIYSKLDFTILRPDQIGSDLVANAYGALARFHRDCIVVDFGTALTVTGVGVDRQIHGVSIAPGIKTALRALRSNTARLPEVPLKMPASTLGRNTEEAIQSGVLVGYVGLVEKLITEYQAQWQPEAYVIATGGLNRVLTPLRSLFHEVYLNLTLDGLHAIGQRLNSLRD